MPKIFCATDLHGSEMCWRKFLNAAKFYEADVLICGGDMTGKAMIPIVEENGHYTVTIAADRQVVGAEMVGEIENQIRRRGYYPLHVTPERLQEQDETADVRKETFQPIMLHRVRSTAVRQAIDKHQPMLSMHGHIHESKGAVKLGKTLSINPGSSYEEGILMSAIISLDAKKGIKSYQLVNG